MVCLYFVKAPPRDNFYSAKRLGEDGCNIFASPLSSEGCLVFPDLQQYPMDHAWTEDHKRGEGNAAHFVLVFGE